MKVTWDKSTDVGYIQPKAAAAGGMTAMSIPLDELEANAPGTQIGRLTVDFDEERRLVGIEVFGARRALHPSLPETARISG